MSPPGTKRSASRLNEIARGLDAGMIVLAAMAPGVGSSGWGASATS